jgi:hypothetical protein
MVSQAPENLSELIGAIQGRGEPALASCSRVGDPPSAYGLSSKNLETVGP